MQAGQLRSLITIQQTTQTVGNLGEVVDSWATFKVRSAKVVPLNGRERFTENRERSVNQVRFELRRLAGVTPKMRVSWDSRIFDIVSVINVDERNRELHLMTEEAETTS